VGEEGVGVVYERVWGGRGRLQAQKDPPDAVLARAVGAARPRGEQGGGRIVPIQTCPAVLVSDPRACRDPSHMVTSDHKYQSGKW